MKSQKKISIIITYIGLLLGILIYFFVTPMAIDHLGKNEYGVYSLVYTVVTYFTVLDFGFGNAIVRYVAKYIALKNNKKIYEMIGLFLIIYSIISLIALSIGLLIIGNISSIFSALTIEEIGIAKKMIEIALINIVLSFPLSVFLAVLKGYEKFILAEVVHVLKLLVSPLSIFVAILFGYKSIGIITLQTITNILISLIPTVYCLFVIKVKIRFPKSKKDLSIVPEIAKFSFYVFLSLMVTKVFWSTDQVILGAFVSSAAVSICSLVAQIVQYYSSISETITKPYLSIVTKKVTLSKDKRDFTDLFIKIGRMQFIIIALILTGFIAFGERFVVLWAGKDFKEVYVIALMVLVPLTVPAIQNVGVSILQALNLHKFRSLVYFAISILNIIVSLLLVGRYGIYGTTIGTVLALVIGHTIIMNIYYSKKLQLNLRKFWGNIFSIFVKIIILPFIFYIISNCILYKANWLIFATEVLAYIIVYLIVMVLFVFNKEEKKLFSKFTIFFKRDGKNGKELQNS